MSTLVLTPEQRRDAEVGMAWWNGLTKPERRHWLDLAQRRNERATGHQRYTLEDMPSAADAWATFKESGVQLNDGPHG